MPLVVHIVRKFEPSAWGGIETHLVGLLPELARLGWDSEVHAPCERGTDGSPLTRIGIDFRTFRARYPVLGLGQQGREALVSCGGNLVSVEELVRLAADRRASLLHAHTQRRLGGVVRTAARLRGVPYAVTLHGPVRAGAASAGRPEGRAHGRGRDVGAPFGWLVGAHRVVDDADLVFTLNRSERDAWTADRAGRHLALVRLGVNASRASEDDKQAARKGVPGLGAAPFVVVVARLDPAKGQDAAIVAFRETAAAGVHLVVAGAPTDAAYAERLRRLAGTDPRIHLTGNVPPQTARALFAASHLAMVPSRCEPFGLSLLEAWAEGTPVLFSDVGGLSEIADRAGATWGRIASPDALTSRLADALRDGEGRARDAENGPERVARHFSWRSLAEETAAAYASCAPRPGRRSWAWPLQWNGAP